MGNQKLRATWPDWFDNFGLVISTIVLFVGALAALLVLTSLRPDGPDPTGKIVVALLCWIVVCLERIRGAIVTSAG